MLTSGDTALAEADLVPALKKPHFLSFHAFALWSFCLEFATAFPSLHPTAI